tara:strand:- start:197 stop:430 length:234 start_codon:yes stop_codon:yes gene_type:complete
MEIHDERIRCQLVGALTGLELSESETMRLLGNFELVLTANQEMTDYVWLDVYDFVKEEYVCGFSLETSYSEEIRHAS